MHPFAQSSVQKLVEATQSHPLFESHYNFPSFMEGWKHSKKGDHNSPVRLISIDCEFAICENKHYNVVRICAIESNWGSECGSDYIKLFDKLVVPSKKSN